MDAIVALLAADRLPGVLLVTGGALLVLLAAPTAALPPAIWTGAPEVSLPLIARHRTIWRLANIGFLLATVLVAAGLFLVPSALGADGAALATAGAVAFAIAAMAWIITLSIRLGFTPGVAARYVNQGSLDPSFPPLARLAGVLFASFILVGSGALTAIGVAALLGGVLPAWAAWATLLISLATIGGYVALGDTLPAFVYVPTTLLGIVLLATG